MSLRRRLVLETMSRTPAASKCSRSTSAFRNADRFTTFKIFRRPGALRRESGGQAANLDRTKPMTGKDQSSEVGSQNS